MPAPDALTPADRYAELFTAVQGGRVFADSKTFVDCAPRNDPAAILADYRVQCRSAGFDLAAFVAVNFERLQPVPSDYVSVPGQPICEHIDALWPVLTRDPQQHPPKGSLLQLPRPYVVPGGRFGELYYWDSYFTMLGLAASGRSDLVRDMVENFAQLIDTWGHVPNGTRTYYLSRSQPPLFAFMVELGARLGVVEAIDSLPQLKREHAWWMQGGESLAPGTAHARGREAAEVYRHLRAAAESGWDFSTRWLAEASQAQATAYTIAHRLLAPGGLSTTEHRSDQQWDRPNGWAALQWMAIDGLARYGQHDLARTIAHRWLATVAAVYEREGKLVEKYALRHAEGDSSAGGSGGEYPLQDGFGWTNGVTRALLAAHPQHSAQGCLAHAAVPQHR